MTAPVNPVAETGLPGLGTKVAIFATCINDTMMPGAPAATVKLLERLGCTVEFPRSQTCCGQILTNTGYFDEALVTVKSYVKAFGEYDYIVGPSGSCVASVRHQHPMLAQHAKDAGLERESTAVVARSYELTEFLVDVLGVTDVGAYFPHRATYHPTCHSTRFAKVGDRPYRLLGAVRGLELVPLPHADECCGFGGTFSLKNPDVSIAMANDKARHVRATEAEYLIAADNACLLNIGGVLHRQLSGIKTVHLAEVLASTDKDLA
ncbi:(Fe-S)-binding protein [Propioniciclava sp. MC1683]|uniref:(Fe-S)-binding protein n=1 Tax=Propioniciclava sp. MC1683 TaxID=2760309 RepID=UPI0015FF635F|nr:(Fe-S)-binding protein [Propioniciclava sp. MC1683]MBB1502779.1 (Fe-S)-binding protein [Propioniciclava sp. MC1683]